MLPYTLLTFYVRNRNSKRLYYTGLIHSGIHRFLTQKSPSVNILCYGRARVKLGQSALYMTLFHLYTKLQEFIYIFFFLYFLYSAKSEIKRMCPQIPHYYHTFSLQVNFLLEGTHLHWFRGFCVVIIYIIYPIPYFSFFFFFAFSLVLNYSHYGTCT